MQSDNGLSLIESDRVSSLSGERMRCGNDEAPASTPDSLADDERGQFGEIAALQDHLALYGVENKWIVDVGAYNGKLFSNSLAFRRRGWHTVLIECEPELVKAILADLGPGDRHVNVIEAEVEPDRTSFNCLDNLLSHLGRTADERGDAVPDVPEDFDILSIDIDGYDYHVWESLERFRPRFVIIETRDIRAPGARDRFVPEYGEPIAALPSGALEHPYLAVTTKPSMADLAREKGYLVLFASQCNTVFIRKDVAESRPVRLNLGSGFTSIGGFLAVDSWNGEPVYPLDWPDGSVDEIRASHVLEHFGHRQTLLVLEEWCRVLKPNGIMRIAVPSIEQIMAEMDRGTPFNMIEMFITGGQVDDDDHHGTVFTRQKLAAQMHLSGLWKLEDWQSEIVDCASLPVSLNLKGTKRTFEVKQNPRLTCVLSQPRIAFIDQVHCVYRGLRCLSNREMYGKGPAPVVDDVIDCGGAFWEKYISGGIKAAIERGADLILFCDYDGVFQPEDVERLYSYMQDNPDVSAAFAVQVSRHHDNPLVFQDHIVYTDDETRVQLGHFGLTMIRTQIFEDFPRPWLWSVPNPDTGEWDTKGHCDADILFWRQLAEYGHKVVQLGDIQVGHMDLCVKWLTPRGIAYQPLRHYKTYGKLPNAKFNPEAHKAKQS
jgi:SAM-dependent methyltransferase